MPLSENACFCVSSRSGACMSLPLRLSSLPTQHDLSKEARGTDTLNSLCHRGRGCRLIGVVASSGRAVAVEGKLLGVKAQCPINAGQAHEGRREGAEHAGMACTREPAHKSLAYTHTHTQTHTCTRDAYSYKYVCRAHVRRYAWSTHTTCKRPRPDAQLCVSHFIFQSRPPTRPRTLLLPAQAPAIGSPGPAPTPG